MVSLTCPDMEPLPSAVCHALAGVLRCLVVVGPDNVERVSPEAESGCQIVDELIYHLLSSEEFRVAVVYVPICVIRPTRPVVMMLHEPFRYDVSRNQCFMGQCQDPKYRNWEDQPVSHSVLVGSDLPSPTELLCLFFCPAWIRHARYRGLWSKTRYIIVVPVLTRRRLCCGVDRKQIVRSAPDGNREGVCSV